MVRRDRSIKRKLVDILLLACISGLTVGLMSCAGVTSAGNGGGGGGNPGTGTAPIISGVISGSLTAAGAGISWTTDVASSSQVNYGATAAYGQSSAMNSAMVTSHSVTLSALTASTLYHYQVVSKDANGNQTASADFTFTTTAASAPVISAVTAGSITSTGATITWTTDVGATSQVNYGTTTAYGQSSALNSSLVTSHSVALSGLTASTLYHFQVVSKDTNGNPATSSDFTFTTSASTTPPTISAVTAGTITSTGATITWTTNIGATSQVNYGTTTAYGQSSALNSSLVTSHSVALTGLTASTVYHYQVVSKNSNGNQATSGDFTFTTTASTTPPTISAVTAGSITSSGATITWTTNIGATSQVNYGTTTAYGQSSALNSSLVTSHSVALTGLTASTLYHYQVVSKNSNGNQATSGDFTFTTTAATPPDTTAPSVPTGLTATAVSSSQINLKWTASTDNIGVTGYNIFRNNTKVGTSTTTTFTDGGLSASTTYSYTVSAFDAAGNTSAKSSSASATTQASSGGGIPPTQGWFQVPNSTIQAVCPPNNYNSPPYSPYAFASNCHNAIDAWSSAAYDSSRNRLVLFGGGHNDYAGNELYEFNLNTLQTVRLNNPSPPNVDGSGQPVNNCTATLSDGRPNSRHDYGAVTYVANTDQMLVFGGSLACAPGSGTYDLWLLDLSSVTSACAPNCNAVWHGPLGQGAVHPTDTSNLAAIAEYDASTGHVWIDDRNNLYEYNVQTDTYTLRQGASFGLATSAAIDPAHHTLAIIGNDGRSTPNPMIKIVSLASPYTVTDKTSTATGCSAIENGASGPYEGMAWDSTQNKFLIWAQQVNTNNVYTYDPVANACTTVSGFTGGPSVTSLSRGTFGHWRYSPTSQVFVLVAESSQNVFTFRMGTPAPPPPIAVSAAACTPSSTSAVCTWTTNVPGNSQVFYGPTSAYGSSSALQDTGTLVTTHSVTIQGLAASTMFHYKVQSTDQSSNVSSSQDATFTTTSGSTGNPPVISNVSAVGITGSSATITWTTDTASSSAVNYGTTSAYGSSTPTTNSSPGVLQHSVALSGLAASTTYHYQVVSTNASSQTTNSGDFSFTTSAQTTSADADFAARCSAPGVFRCYGFNNATDAANYMHVTATGSPTIDCTTFASGACALKETYAAKSTEGDAGYFSMNFLDDNSMQFGQIGSGVAPNFASGQDFYIQWRQRFDPNILSPTYKWGSDAQGFKQVIISDGDLSAAQCALTPSACSGGNKYDAPTCSDDEIVVQNTYNFNVPEVYHSCGVKDGSYDGLEVFNSPTNPNVVELQNGIQYPGSPGTTPSLKGCIRQSNIQIPPCFAFVANTWMTFQIHVHVGKWYHNDHVYPADSIVQFWGAHEGQPSQILIDFSPTEGDAGGYSLVASGLPGQPVPANWLPQHIYGQINLLAYNTMKDPTITNPVASTWYDELIISTSKIPDPK